jgi:hypothetical protein
MIFHSKNTKNYNVDWKNNKIFDCDENCLFVSWYFISSNFICIEVIAWEIITKIEYWQQILKVEASSKQFYQNK